MGSNKLNNVDSHRSSPSLLGDHDDPLRPVHKRSTSSPSTSLTSLFQRLAVEAQSAGNKGSHRKVSVSPTRRRLFKRQSGNVPQKMDLADGQAGHDKVRDPARKVIQHGKWNTTTAGSQSRYMLPLCASYHRKPLGTCPCCMACSMGIVMITATHVR